MSTPLSEKNDTKALSKLAEADSVEHILSIAREQLGMDVAFLGEIEQGQLMFHSLEGDADSFGLEEDKGIPYGGSYC